MQSKIQFHAYMLYRNGSKTSAVGPPSYANTQTPTKKKTLENEQIHFQYSTDINEVNTFVCRVYKLIQNENNTV